MKTGRLAVLAVILLALAAATSEIAARGEPAQATSCNAALVRYEWNQRAGGGPWVAVGPTRSRLEAWLYSYDQYLEDRRVNQSERMVVRAGTEEKIGWFSRKWGGSRLRVSGRRLDGEGSFAQTFGAAQGVGWYPSGLRVPEPGCWQLTLRTDGWLRQLVVEAIERPAAGTCDPTPVNPSASVRLVPARSGLSAAWSWSTEEGGALLYAGGRTPDGGNTKVLWRATQPGGLLTVRGTRLDGTGTFRQTFTEADPSGYWPSIVVVPTAGCWLLTARGIGKAAGIVVVRVVSG